MRLPGPPPPPNPIYLKLVDSWLAGTLVQADIDSAAEAARSSEDVLLPGAIRELATRAKLRVPASLEPPKLSTDGVLIWDPVAKRIVKPQ